MFSSKSLRKIFIIFISAAFFISCSEQNGVKAEIQSVEQQRVVLDVYKSPSCGCCEKWIKHIDESGFQSNVYNELDISVIKNKKGIAPRYRSCHTVISKDGYIFEGHVPAKFIQQFLTEPHATNVLGLSVPAMPIGTPGMEVNDKFQPYRVLLLKSDGSFDTYANVQSYQEQF